MIGEMVVFIQRWVVGQERFLYPIFIIGVNLLLAPALPRCKDTKTFPILQAIRLF